MRCRRRGPFDWQRACPELVTPPFRASIRRVWPYPERVVIVEELTPAVWPVAYRDGTVS